MGCIDESPVHDGEYVMLVEWVGLENDEKGCEPLPTIRRSRVSHAEPAADAAENTGPERVEAVARYSSGLFLY